MKENNPTETYLILYILYRFVNKAKKPPPPKKKTNKQKNRKNIPNTQRLEFSGIYPAMQSHLPFRHAAQGDSEHCM